MTSTSYWTPCTSPLLYTYMKRKTNASAMYMFSWRIRGRWEDQDVVGRTILERNLQRYALVIKTVLILLRTESNDVRLLLRR